MVYLDNIVATYNDCSGQWIDNGVTQQDQIKLRRCPL